MMEFMMYKGDPLVRKGNDIYLGYMSEPYVIWLQAENLKEEKGVQVAHKVRFYQMKTDENLNPVQAIVKQSEKNSLYEALDIAYVWLSRQES